MIHFSKLFYVANGEPASSNADFDLVLRTGAWGRDIFVPGAIAGIAAGGLGAGVVAGLEVFRVKPSRLDCLERQREEIESEIKDLNTKSNYNKEEGYFKKLSPTKIPLGLYDKTSVLLNELKEYGVFIVPRGTLEQWLDTKQDTDEDKLINLLRKIDDTAPTNDDVWKFIDDINIWISNPERRGMFV